MVRVGTRAHNAEAAPKAATAQLFVTHGVDVWAGYRLSNPEDEPVPQIWNAQTGLGISGQKRQSRHRRRQRTQMRAPLRSSASLAAKFFCALKPFSASAVKAVRWPREKSRP